MNQNTPKIDALFDVHEFKTDISVSVSYRENKERIVREFEKTYVTMILGHADGNISLAARMGKTDRKHLSDLAKKHGIKRRTSR